MNAARIAAPTRTRANPTIFINVKDSPRKKPINAATAMLPPIIIGPVTEIANPEPYALRAKTSTARAQIPVRIAKAIPLELKVIDDFKLGIRIIVPIITAVRETIIAPNKLLIFAAAF